jgi:hypothetical protein
VLQTPYTVESASYCAERKRWAAGGNDMWVHLYDYDTGAELDVNKGVPSPCRICLGVLMPWCQSTEGKGLQRTWVVGTVDFVSQMATC